jgi:hypothetical protein
MTESKSAGGHRKTVMKGLRAIITRLQINLKICARYARGSINGCIRQPKNILIHINKKKVIILTDPPGAKIFIREYSDSLGKWKKLGITPIDSVELPNHSYIQNV